MLFSMGKSESVVFGHFDAYSDISCVIPGSPAATFNLNQVR